MNGGKINDSSENIVVPVAENERVSKPSDPEKAGYVFVGWYIKDAIGLYDFTTPITGDITLNASYAYSNPSTGIVIGGTTPATPITPAEGSNEVTVPADCITVNQTENKFDIKVDSKVANLVKGSKADTLTIPVGNYDIGTDVSLNVPKSVIEQLVENDMNIEVELGESATFTVAVEKAGELNIIMCNVEQLAVSDEYTNTPYCFDINVTLDGNPIVINDNKAVKIELNVSDIEDLTKAGVYTVDENGELQYVMTYLNGDVISFYPPHFSPYCVMVFNKTFEDIKGHWAQKYIESMASKHVVNGKTENIFDPEATITRAEFVTMVVRALGLSGQGKTQFANIAKDKWYAEYISLAKDAGLIEGKTYNADGLISRAEMAKTVARAHAILNRTEVKFEGNLKFTDVEAKSEYTEFIGYANENGLINGFPGELFMPVENTTRAEAMTVIYRLINK